MKDGQPLVIKSRTLRDTVPMCIYVNKQKAITVGDSAYNAHKRDCFKSQKGWGAPNNSFIEFTRTLGSDKTYFNSNTDKSFTSQQLLAEIIRELLSFEKEDIVKALVFAVPVVFGITQIEAVKQAGKLAGLKQIEIIRKPIAASLFHGLNSNKKDGFWLVFDFGEGSFDAALVKAEDGIMKVIDTEGNHHLGGKDLDFAIVDEIILPYIEENFVVDSILADDAKKQILRNAMKFYAEETKIQLSFNDTYNILSELGDIHGNDDEGEEFELDITVTQADIANVVSPVFQLAINHCIALLKRNNLQGTSLDSLILVGGPTFSPVLRKMLEEQICKPDTSVDPMTVVAKGAALYASTVDLSEDVREQTRDKSKVQLEIVHAVSTVETEEYVPIRILEEKTKGEIPNKVFAEVNRGDKAWSSGKVEINTIGDVVEVQLNEGETNVFEVVLYDDKGNTLECNPSNFNIIHGYGPLYITLPYNIGVEKKMMSTGGVVFKTIRGLEMNQRLPAVGTIIGLKTQKQIRPGVDSDFIRIPIYEGERGADGTRAADNEHVLDIIISGSALPNLLPENSDVDLTVRVDVPQNITASAYLPAIDYSFECNIEFRKTLTVKGKE